MKSYLQRERVVLIENSALQLTDSQRYVDTQKITSNSDRPMSARLQLLVLGVIAAIPQGKYRNL